MLLLLKYIHKILIFSNNLIFCFFLSFKIPYLDLFVLTILPLLHGWKYTNDFRTFFQFTCDEYFSSMLFDDSKTNGKIQTRSWCFCSEKRFSYFLKGVFRIPSPSSKNAQKNFPIFFHLCSQKYFRHSASILWNFLSCLLALAWFGFHQST